MTTVFFECVVLLYNSLFIELYNNNIEPEYLEVSIRRTFEFMSILLNKIFCVNSLVTVFS